MRIALPPAVRQVRVVRRRHDQAIRLQRAVDLRAVRPHDEPGGRRPGGGALLELAEPFPAQLEQGLGRLQLLRVEDLVVGEGDAHGVGADGDVVGEVGQGGFLLPERAHDLGQVAAGVAHEINQPLATIRAYADNAKVFLGRGKPASASENLDHIANLTDRIAAITEDLKALARKGRTAEEPVVIREVIDGALMLLRSRFTGRLDRLVVAPFPMDLDVLGNRLRLEQVLINLFQNALEAVEPRPDGRVDVRVAVDGDEVVVTVADNGPGLSEAILAQLFEPFNTSKEKGLGLGLVIAKDIVSDYGGRLEVETGASGVTFSVHLRKAVS